MNKRNIGVDLLRILSMYMIMTLHVMSNGGSLLEHQVNTFHTQTILILTVLNNVAVNLFALISGYVGLHSHHRVKRIVDLWLQVIFFSWGIMLFFKLMDPKILNHYQVIASIFPTLSKQYWYFNSYLLLFILMPLVNSGLKQLTKRQFQMLCLALFGVTSCMGGVFYHDSFAIGDGFSGIWLMVMYIFGAYLKEYGLGIGKKISFVLYFAVALVGWAVVNLTVLGKPGYASGKILYDNWFNWFNYNNPIMVLGAIFLFWFFVNLKINNKHLVHTIEFISPLAFGTYLLQTNYIVYAWFKNQYAGFYGHGVLTMVALILITAFGWFVLGSLVEWIRQYLFNKLNIVNMVAGILREPYKWLLKLGATDNVKNG